MKLRIFNFTSAASTGASKRLQGIATGEQRKKHLMHCGMIVMGNILLSTIFSHYATSAPAQTLIRQTAHQKKYEAVTVFSEADLPQLYHKAAQTILSTIQKNPRALIVLPTGTTPEPMYRQIVSEFRKNPDLDFSKATFFNLDEYVGLGANHPLSYSYYMQTNFYQKLQEIDERRAPKRENQLIPTLKNDETPGIAARRYQTDLMNAIAASSEKKIDLVVLGVGGAYPEIKGDGSFVIKGAHFAFNEPGTSRALKTHLVQLTDKTRADTRHRFHSLAWLLKTGTIVPPAGQAFATDVPQEAITMGPADVLNAKKVLVLAVGEDKAPSLAHCLDRPISSNFPTSYLQDHQNVEWLLDENAAYDLAYRPWFSNKGDRDLPQAWFFKGAQDLMESQNLSAKTLEAVHFQGIGISQKAVQSYKSTLSDKTGAEGVVADFQGALEDRIGDHLLPANQTVLVFSPHPDDDVISMGATLNKLVQRNNDVHVAYVVNGSNAVRDTHPRFKEIVATLHGEGAKEQAKTQVRQEEAARATQRHKVTPKNLHFFNAEFYHRRGIPGLPPFGERDIREMSNLIKKIQPSHIFFAAENDPHGAHGLSSQLIAEVFKSAHFSALNLPSKTPVRFYGYRGAWIEWSMHQGKNLMIIPFDQALMKIKMVSIKDHDSQLDPIYPGCDPRPFFQRAQERNESSAKILRNLFAGHTFKTASVDLSQMKGVEIFHIFDHEAFVRRYGQPE